MTVLPISAICGCKGDSEADSHRQELWMIYELCDLETYLNVAVDDAVIGSRGRREACQAGTHRLQEQVLITR